MKPTFQGEMQLMNWGESSQSGAWVKFWIESESLESFRDLKTKSGKIAGHRMMAVLVEVGDDELPMQREPEPPASQEKPKGGPLAKFAGTLCAFSKEEKKIRERPLFWDFLESQYGEPIESEDDAKECIYQECGITSRIELDHNNAAAEIFHRLIRLPFIEWQNLLRES